MKGLSRKKFLPSRQKFLGEISPEFDSFEAFLAWYFEGEY